MEEKKLYIWRLAEFLDRYNMKMSAEELANHLNRNGFLTSYGTEYQGGRGTYKLISETWHWINDALKLPDEARKVSHSFVKSDGTFAYQ